MDKRTFVIGDIHGAYRALMQCFEQAAFDYNNDQLICLGDVCDGWPEVNKAIDELLKVKNLVYILGNHDDWALKWFETGDAPDIWIGQGGNATIKSYNKDVPLQHIQFLQSAKLYYILENRLFTHGGYNPQLDIEKQGKETFLWDRTLLKTALKNYYDRNETHLTPYEEVYIGHTPTINYGNTRPLKIGEIYMMDTGAGWPGGVLTIMDIHSKKYYSSDRVDELYPGIPGRGR